MKKIKFIITLCAISLLVGCNKELEVGGVSLIEGEGVVILPNQAKWSADELEIICKQGKLSVENGKFLLNKIDTTSSQLWLAQHPNSNFFMMSWVESGENHVEFSASSTAIALLMLNPIVPYLSEMNKKKLVESYKKHELFAALVREFDSNIQNKNDFLYENSKIISLTNRIHGSQIKVVGNRMSDNKEIQLTNETVKVSLVGNTITMQNFASFLPYTAIVYDENDKQLSERIKLGMAGIKGTSAEFLIYDTYEILTNWDDCWDEFGTKGIPNCKQQFFKGEVPKSVHYTFSKNGKYKIKIFNGTRFLEDSNVETNLIATETGYQIFLNCLSYFDSSFATKLKNCDTKAGIEIFEDFVKFGLSASSEDNSYELIKSVSGIYLDAIVKMSGCINNAEADYLRKTLEKFEKLSQYLSVFGRLGAFLNLNGQLYNLKHDRNYYEICIEVIDGKASICNEIEIPSSETPPEIYVGGKSFGDPNLVTFDGKNYGFNAVGEFLITKSSSDNFEVQARQEELKSINNSGSVSWTTGLALRIGSDRINFFPSNLIINGEYRSYKNENITLTNSTIYIENGRVQIISSTDDYIEIYLYNDNLNYSVMPSKKRQNKLVGLFGNYDGNPNNDLIIKNGNQINGSFNTLYPNFADSWRIAQATSLFYYEAGKNTNFYTNKNFPKSEFIIDPNQRAFANQICNDAGVSPPYLEGCIIDVIATGRPEMAERARRINQLFQKSFSLNLGMNSISNFKIYSRFSNIERHVDYVESERILGISTDLPIKLSNSFSFECTFQFSGHSVTGGELNLSLLQQYTSGSIFSFINLGKPPINNDTFFSTKGGYFQKFNDFNKTVDIFDGKKHMVKVKYTLKKESIYYSYYIADVYIDNNILASNLMTNLDIWDRKDSHHVDIFGKCEPDGKFRLYNYKYTEYENN